MNPHILTLCGQISWCLLILFSIVDISPAKSPNNKPESKVTTDELIFQDVDQEFEFVIRAELAKEVELGMRQLANRDKQTKFYTKMLGVCHGTFSKHGRLVAWQGAYLYVPEGIGVRVFQSKRLYAISEQWVTIKNLSKSKAQELLSSKIGRKQGTNRKQGTD